MMDEKKFVAHYDNFILVVTRGGFAWVWHIFKESLLIDAAFYHPLIPTSELDAKIKCERALTFNIKNNERIR